MARGTLFEKILKEHLVDGEMTKEGAEIGIRIDQTLTQDATGTMAYLQFEALGIPRVRTELSVSYIDHNTLQTGFENADDHAFLQSIAQKYGILLSRAGNGICHQVHLERFAVPGKTLLGSDSHTPTAGGVGMIAIGAGGLDVAVAMGAGPFFLKMPKVVGVKLSGRLPPWVSAKDVVLEVLRRLGVAGGRGKVLEYYGPGVKRLSVPERATITNMGTETGATTSLFPSDEVTKAYLELQGRGNSWTELRACDDVKYDEKIRINLSEVVPMVAKPHSPGSVVAVSELEGLAVDQVAIGSCTNSSYLDLMIAAKILEGKTVRPGTSLVISPGSRQVLISIMKNGGLDSFVRAGARVLECTCGPCIGMGQAPRSGAVSVRTFNRNFEGRSGTADAGVYLVSAETAAATALFGKLTDPRKLGEKAPKIPKLKGVETDDAMILRPPSDGSAVEVVRGPNIKPLPLSPRLPASLEGEALIKVGNDISTDHIMPAGAKILPLRSNIPAMSEHVFEAVDSSFAKRAKEKGGGFIIGGDNYGQGSSREHAALAPMYLGVTAVIVKSFARIHKANLVNFGIIPLEFADKDGYDRVAQGDVLEIPDIRKKLEDGGMTSFDIINKTKGGEKIRVKHDLSLQFREMLLEGGLLNYTKARAERKRMG